MRVRSTPRVNLEPGHYSKRLAVIIPYRDREKHFQVFVPHMLNYFGRDKLDCQIDYQLHIVEQADNKPLNRGLLKNIGFELVKDQTDYVCFHDIDYLPLWADYSYSKKPARLIWHGLMASATSKERPQGAPNQGTFFGGVVMFNNQDFIAINGYSNGYWGWGAEDTELRMRCNIAGLEIEHRDGTYRALKHEHHGFKAGTLEFNQEAEANHRRLVQRTPQLPQLMKQDGLGDLVFTHLSSEPVMHGDLEFEQVIVHRVTL